MERTRENKCSIRESMQAPAIAYDKAIVHFTPSLKAGGGTWTQQSAYISSVELLLSVLSFSPPLPFSTLSHWEKEQQSALRFYSTVVAIALATDVRPLVSENRGKKSAPAPVPSPFLLQLLSNGDILFGISTKLFTIDGKRTLPYP